jgi:hypothetical protein
VKRFSGNEHNAEKIFIFFLNEPYMPYYLSALADGKKKCSISLSAQKVSTLIYQSIKKNSAFLF